MASSGCHPDPVRWRRRIALETSTIAYIAAALGIPHLVVLPLLALTFLSGPAGLLAFAVLCAVRRWRRSAPAPV